MYENAVKIKTKQILRPTKAAIDLSALEYNFKKIRKIIGKNCKLMFSIKANGYGHGMSELALFTQKNKLVDGFAVALIEEALELKRARITLPILVLGSIYPFSSFETALKNDFSVTVASLKAAKKINEISERLKIKAKCHIKIDTGLGRIGTRHLQVLKVFKYLSNKKYIKIEGAYTHFASSDDDISYTKSQLKNFQNVISQCNAQKIPTGVKHCANSYAMIKYPNTHFDMVRPGLCAYGLVAGFKPVLSLKSKIVFLKNVKKGGYIGYSKSYKCSKNLRVATIPIGYGDGYPRTLSNKGYVLINGKKCNILGNIAMDMIMVDVTCVENVKIGDEVVLIGRQKKSEITACELAVIAKTIPYEITTSILPRVPRVYIK